MTRFVESTITFPYKRSLGPVIGAFMSALTDKRILGIHHGVEVIVSPMEWDPHPVSPTLDRVVDASREGGPHPVFQHVGRGVEPSAVRPSHEWARGCRG